MLCSFHLHSWQLCDWKSAERQRSNFVLSLITKSRSSCIVLFQFTFPISLDFSPKKTDSVILRVRQIIFPAPISKSFRYVQRTDIRFFLASSLSSCATHSVLFSYLCFPLSFLIHPFCIHSLDPYLIPLFLRHSFPPAHRLSEHCACLTGSNRRLSSVPPRSLPST